jgi:hypothetical protein
MLVASGCAIWNQEKNNRGGYIDYLADKYWLKADSKKMRALRAFALQVSLARIASVAPKNESDRQLMAIRIGATTARAKTVLTCAFDGNPLGVPGAEADPCFYFDSAMVDYATALFDLAMLALPLDEAKKLANSITGSIINPLDAIEVLTTLVNLGEDALKYGRVVGALYRDTIELEVQVWLATPNVDQSTIPPAYQITPATVVNLQTIYDRKNDDLVAWKAEIIALRSQGLEPIPDRKFIYQLAGLMRYICGLITKEANPLAACIKDLPATIPAAPSAVGPVAVMGTAPKQSFFNRFRSARPILR